MLVTYGADRPNDDEVEDEPCKECGGTGEVLCPVWNDDSKRYEMTGSEPCPECNRREEDEDK